MSDRPSAVNGKRNQAWGTLRECPACGQCLCFGCHPAGPCVDDSATFGSFADGGLTAGFGASGFPGALEGAWLAGGTSHTTGVAGLRMHGAGVPGVDQLR
jgi:hypothetical protein